ncbi:hypothetical protein PS645_01831 [Pseudomonas fluorescens]|uniref:Uncharacterized protein n=1 Tax=Pseudomonas fluorescens TaxID=294 RepID=A0A5E6RX35_PSEFL|nr:hypothetical protein [Pseudomonas fluorescens]VVM72412.1 hypothetical protein PS645_01831 [Pseudomonas fluorescens]
MFATAADGRKVVLNKDGTWEYQTSIVASSGAGNNFRKLSWGTHRLNIKQSEPSTSWLEGEGYLGFESALGGNECLVLFVLLNDILVRGKYVFNQKFANDNTYLSKFDEFKEMLQKKYGAPESDNEYWLNDLYQDDYQSWGMAVSAGHMSRFTTWIDGATKICLSLAGESFQCDLSIEYSSIEYEAEERKHNEDTVLDLL